MTGFVEIPEDIMQAAENALDDLLCNCRESCGSYDAARMASITDIACAILEERKRGPSALPVVVKPLEWEYRERQVMTYFVKDDRGVVYYIDQTFGSDSYYFTTVRYDGKILYDGDDLPSAQAAAQADYEARILSALIAPQTSEAPNA